MPVPTTVNIESPEQYGFHGALGSSLFRLIISEEEPLVISRGPTQVEVINTSVNPDDYNDRVGRTYSQVQFTGGEGLRFAQRRNNPEDAATRFFWSQHLQLTPEGDLEVTNQTEEVLAGSALPAPAQAVYARGALYIASPDSPDLTVITNLQDPVPTVTVEPTGAASGLLDITVLGDGVYVCDGNEILWDQGIGTWVQWSSMDAVRIWSIKNRITASDGPRLYENPEGSVTPADTFLELPLGEEWMWVSDIGDYGLAVASGGEFYAFRFDGSTFAVSAEGEFNDETVVAATNIYGQVVLLTYQNEADDTVTSRLWVGDVDPGTGLPVSLKVVREFDGLNRDTRPVYLRTAERASVFFGIDDGTDLILYMYDASFNSLMSDIQFDGATGKYVQFIRKIDGFFWVVNDDGSVWRETSTKRPQGTFVGPMIDFYTAEDKVWDQIIVNGVYPDENSSLRLFAASNLAASDDPFNTDYWSAVRNFYQTENTRAQLNRKASRYLAVRVDVIGNAVFDYYAVDSLPPTSQEEIEFTINVSDEFSRPGKRSARARGYGNDLWKSFRGLQGQSLVLSLFPYDIQWMGTILEVRSPADIAREPSGITRGTRIRFRGERLESRLLTDISWGLYPWGRMLWGGTPVKEFNT